MRRILRWVALLLMAVMAAALLWLYDSGRGITHAVRWQPDPGPALVQQAGESFPSYRARAVAHIRQYLSPAFPPETLAWLAPFEWHPGPGCAGREDRGVLLFHGLTDSPFSLRDLAARLVGHCQTVRVILLPGHGTVPGHLLGVTLEDWRRAVDQSVLSFQAEHPHYWLGGYSLGGALAVDYVRRHPEASASGLLLVAPALDLDSGALWVLPWLNRISGWLPRLAWLDLHDDTNPVKYESFPVNAAWQMARLVRELNDGRVIRHWPLWAVLTADDATVSAPSSLALLCRMMDPQQGRMIWYGSKAPARSCPGVEWQRPAAGVLDYSHVSLPFSPDNPVYGKTPLYYSCVHYPAGSTQWRLCKGLESLGTTEPASGEITEANLQYPVLRRLTYHPGFDAMADDMLAFVAAAPPVRP